MAKRIRDPRSRQHLVETTRRLVAARGAAATTMRAVAAEAGVTTGSVTHYFDDKAELMTAVLRHNGEVAAQRVVDSVGNRRGLDAVRRAVHGLLPVDEQQLTCWQVWLAFWSHAPEERDGGFSDGYEVWRALLKQHLAEAVEDGDLPTGLDLPHEVRVLGALVVGTGLLAGSDPAARRRLRRRARRVFNEHFERLARSSGAE
ncbi:TetR/AcrR family transcriptional regulator [Saccharopolyspora sp. SCSIO 74807]|uniref:TetR/AcrR family transcriptional regulator n=1 Tax=Saccharopolyspora sp. SCSIO 74807 TaxID=3118084 RepID=UPI0030D46F47